MEPDKWAGASILVFSALISTAYGIRLGLKGPAHFSRVERQGGSILLAKSVMEMGYWALQPFLKLLVKLRIKPDHISWMSLVTGLAAGVCLGFELYGLGALVAIIAGVFDCMDGMLARELDEISLAGGLLDSSLDRYVEFALMGGLAIAYRHSPLVLAITLLAILGSFMVSYSTAKADQYAFTPPRGAMRRSERMVYLLLGTTISAMLGSQHEYQPLPVVASLTVIAVFGNHAAIIRLSALRKELRTRARNA